MGEDSNGREITTTVITVGGRAYLPDLGPMPDAETLYAFARFLKMYVAFEISTHVKSFGVEQSPVYDPRHSSRICVGLCKTKGDVPLLASSSFEVVNTEKENG